MVVLLSLPTCPTWMLSAVPSEIRDGESGWDLLCPGHLQRHETALETQDSWRHHRVLLSALCEKWDPARPLCLQVLVCLVEKQALSQLIFKQRTSVCSWTLSKCGFQFSKGRSQEQRMVLMSWSREPPLKICSTAPCNYFCPNLTQVSAFFSLLSEVFFLSLVFAFLVF